MGERIQVTKTEAAKSQLKTAIRLFFDDTDPVSVHTLAAAAHGILHDLGPEFEEDYNGVALRGRGSVIKALPVNVPRNKFVAFIHKAQNFFKHADRDRNDILELDTVLTEGYLMDAYQMYFRLVDQSFTEGHVYLGWIAVIHPDWIQEGPWKEGGALIRRRAEELGLSIHDKSTFRRLLESPHVE